MCFGGSSSAENQISNEQSQMLQTLMNNYGQMFKGQTAILSNLQNSATPILAAGPNQYGYSPAEDSALRTLSDTSTANAYQAAKQATGEQLSGVGGGNTFLPNGTEAGIDANLANTAAQARANQQLGITTSGYATGRQNYLNAASILGGVAAQDNPLGYAGATTNAGNSAFGSANTINQQNNAALQTEMGLIGGGASAILGGFGNLDTTGGSTGGEQVMNFLGGI